VKSPINDGSRVSVRRPRRFPREEPLVNHLAEAVHYRAPVEINTGRTLVLQRMEGRALSSTSSACAYVCRLIASNSGWPGVTHSRLCVSAVSRSVEQRGSDRKALRVSSRHPFRSDGARWCPRRLEGVRKVWNGLESERHVFGRVAQEPRDSLGHDPPLLRERSTLYKHFKD